LIAQAIFKIKELRINKAKLVKLNRKLEGKSTHVYYLLKAGISNTLAAN
jgi:hypothetical protein